MPREYVVYLHGLPMNVYCLIGVKWLLGYESIQQIPLRTLRVAILQGSALDSGDALTV